MGFGWRFLESRLLFRHQISKDNSFFCLWTKFSSSCSQIYLICFLRTGRLIIYNVSTLLPSGLLPVLVLFDNGFVILSRSFYSNHVGRLVFVSFSSPCSRTERVGFLHLLFCSFFFLSFRCIVFVPHFLGIHPLDVDYVLSARLNTSVSNETSEKLTKTWR